MQTPPIINVGPPAPKPITKDDLPPAAQALIGKACGCGCCSQPLCPPNPNLTCQVVSVGKGMNPPYIANGLKGDLVLCPGDGQGVIGAMMGALQPPQVYTHMGIMVADKFFVRHTTAIDGRMQSDPSGRLFGLADVPAPIDGFDPNKIKYGWPGTITQSVEEAWRASQDSSTPFFAAANYSDRPSADAPHIWNVNALSFDAVYDSNGSRRPALIVSACPSAQNTHPELRPMLQRVADEALAMRGHYRFYSYTNAAISMDPAYLGPPMPLYDSAGKQREGTMPDPSDPCKQVPVDHTVPLCCSSFIWTAIQRLKAKGVLIELDPDVKGEPAVPAGCEQKIPPQWGGDAPDPKGITPDGLYYYSIAQRGNAGQALYQKLHDTVDDGIQHELDQLFAALDKTVGFKVPRIGWAILLFALGNSVSPVGAIGELLGIAVADAQAVFDLLTDMPEDIANQMCNSFANDNQSGANEESTAWKSPGEGRAVSPDDIIWFWEPTTFIGATTSSAVEFRGLYGQNSELVLRPPMWGDQPKCQWQVSSGRAPLHGQIFLEGSSAGVAGAVVTCACEHAWSNVDGYTMDVPAGTYWATASWQDPKTDIVWSAAESVDIPWPGGAIHNFTLKPPPVDWRMVEIHGHADMVDRKIIGNDIWTHPAISLTARMGPFGNPAVPSDTTGTTWEAKPVLSCGDEDALQVDIQLSWRIGGFIDVTLKVFLMDGTDVEDTRGAVFTLNPFDVKVVAPMDLVNSEFAAPDRAHLEITFENKQQN